MLKGGPATICDMCVDLGAVETGGSASGISADPTRRPGQPLSLVASGTLRHVDSTARRATRPGCASLKHW